MSYCTIHNKPIKNGRCEADRETTMERVAGLLAIRDVGQIKKATEYLGMLTVLHPELTPTKRAELALDMAKKD